MVEQHLDVTSLPPALIRLLDWAVASEQMAAGPRRRPAQRFTREVLGGAIESGYPMWLLAAHLGIRADSLRSRAQRGGWLLATKVEEGAGLAPETLSRWHDQEHFSDARTGPNHERYYRAEEVVQALTTAAASRPPASGRATSGRARRAR